MRRPEFRELRDKLDYCKDVRNLLSHNPKVGERYAVEPSDDMVSMLAQVLERVRHPRQARHIWVPRAQVCCATLKDFVHPMLQKMYEQRYTHVPILRNGAVMGVFSENTLLTMLLTDAPPINEQTRFSDLSAYLPVARHRAEVFRFAAPSAPVCEIEALFVEAARKQERIGMIFVTTGGNPAGRLLGIISPQDAAAID
jgi:predicted transcriptional regulator